MDSFNIKNYCFVAGPVEKEKTKSSVCSKNTTVRKDFNVIYVYPEDASNDSWQKVQKFAEIQKSENQMKGSRIYVIQSSEEMKKVTNSFSQTIENCLDKLVVADGKLTEENMDHIMQMKEQFSGEKQGIRFALLYDKTEINMLMASSNSRYLPKSHNVWMNDLTDDITLKKKLSEVIEQETANLLQLRIQQQSGGRFCSSVLS